MKIACQGAHVELKLPILIPFSSKVTECRLLRKDEPLERCLCVVEASSWRSQKLQSVYWLTPQRGAASLLQQGHLSPASLCPPHLESWPWPWVSYDASEKFSFKTLDFLTTQSRLNFPQTSLQHNARHMLTAHTQETPEQENGPTYRWQVPGTVPLLSVTSQSQCDLTVLFPAHFKKFCLSINCMNPGS